MSVTPDPGRQWKRSVVNEREQSEGAAVRGESAACPFCSEAVRREAVAEFGTVLAIEDAAPVTPGHLLIITRRHTPDFFSMTDREQRDALQLLAILRERALAADPTITGLNFGANCGASAGQRVGHAHIHFIPRREGDARDSNGPKGVIRNKMTY